LDKVADILKLGKRKKIHNVNYSIQVEKYANGILNTQRRILIHVLE